MSIRFAHTNIIAKDWQKLSWFYRHVFGLKPVPPTRDISGEWAEKLTGISGVHITGEHLTLPGYEGTAPTLEIFSYEKSAGTAKAINSLGFAHIAFEVDDVKASLKEVIREGGGQIGEVVSVEYPGKVYATFVYAKDPEGNILELQSWKRSAQEHTGNPYLNAG